MKPVQVTIEGQITCLYSGSYALVIGISDYSAGFPDLPGVLNDVQLVKEALEKQEFGVTLIQNPDDKTLKSSISYFINSHGATENNRLLIYIAGHGQTCILPDGREMGYIVPANAPLPDRDKTGFHQKSLSMMQVDTYARDILSKHALFIFDACFSGKMFNLTRSAPAAISAKTRQPVRQFLTSGSADEEVPDESLFRKFFITAVTSPDADANKDGYVTASELSEYIITNVINYSNENQHPQFGKIRDQYLDKGDFVFVVKPAGADSVTPVPPSSTPVIAEEQTITQVGSLKLTTEIAGALYIDGVFMRQVNANTVLTIDKLTEGAHTVKIAGDETVEKEVVISANETAGLTIDKRRTDASSLIPETVFIQGGTFQMGSNEVVSDEKPVHTVTVGNLYMGKYEVTVAQFRQFINEAGYQTDADKDGGSYMWTGDKWEKRSGVNWKCDAEGNIRPQSEYNHPVIHVSWNDANEYCNWLSRKTGKSYRLPTEAEWEYAAGNGSMHTKYSWGNGDPYGKSGGNVADESAKRKFGWSGTRAGYDDGYATTAPVGSFNPNDFGLYDMTGNVWEWCSDWYGSYYYKNSPTTDPNGPSTGSYRVSRGGGWGSGARDCRTANRGSDGPDYRSGGLGFRLVLVP
jgi:formylglycine-generating enzyme required for sulfatase activity